MSDSETDDPKDEPTQIQPAKRKRTKLSPASKKRFAKLLASDPYEDLMKRYPQLTREELEEVASAHGF